MSGPEMLAEIERRDYYDRKLREHTELVQCWWFAIQIGVIVACLLSIAGHLLKAWQAFEAGL